ncbi:hypothetical protein EYC84_004903 [Monilinia fructicola]|uniref:Uncharacterized protein n=1 Tax=Monilinia fructicola TaxID=38448 RepID=A0A5M9K5R0_MONFR|nr:hypothetical protein EYC84_004903 [Monilinia fructicola]
MATTLMLNGDRATEPKPQSHRQPTTTATEPCSARPPQNIHSCDSAIGSLDHRCYAADPTSNSTSRSESLNLNIPSFQSQIITWLHFSF